MNIFIFRAFYSFWGRTFVPILSKYPCHPLQHIYMYRCKNNTIRFIKMFNLFSTQSNIGGCAVIQASGFWSHAPGIWLSVSTLWFIASNQEQAASGQSIDKQNIRAKVLKLYAECLRTRKSVFPITLILLSSMAVTATSGVSRPLMAMGMLITLYAKVKIRF